tara:strand:- start:22593 stop:23096 length:504 start_codon:yes stop_codon:yes gene_type:complete
MIKPYKIMTQSMMEVIHPNDVVISIDKFVWSNFSNGDIVAFEKLGDKTTFVKRIVAVSGDTLHIFRNHIRMGNREIPHDSIFEMMVEESDHPDSTNYFNAKKYSEYLIRELGKSKQKNKYLIENGNAIIVPKDHYFMVGDNYYESMDSRFWGFIPKENIKGKVVWVF